MVSDDRGPLLHTPLGPQIGPLVSRGTFPYAVAYASLRGKQTQRAVPKPAYTELTRLRVLVFVFDVSRAAQGFLTPTV